jgi:hypothetical protein
MMLELLSTMMSPPWVSFSRWTSPTRSLLTRVFSPQDGWVRLREKTTFSTWLSQVEKERSSGLAAGSSATVGQ